MLAGSHAFFERGFFVAPGEMMMRILCVAGDFLLDSLLT
jgi:hypothetical protein